MNQNTFSIHPAWMKWLFSFFVVSVAFDWRVGWLGHALLGKIRYSDFFFLAFSGACLWQSLRRRFVWKFPDLGWGIFVFFLSAALSLWVLPSPRPGMSQLIGFGYLLLMYGVVWNYWNHEENRPEDFVRLWIRVSVIISILAALFALLAAFHFQVPLVRFYPTYPNLKAFPRLTGFSTNSNSFMFDLHFACVFALLEWMKARKEKRASKEFAVSFLILLFTGFLTLSRLIAGTLVSLWFLLTMARVRNKAGVWFKRLVGGLSLVFLPFILLITIWTVMPVKVSTLRQGVDREVHVTWNTSPNMYFVLGRACWEMFRDHPWFGVGLDQFRIVQKNYTDRYEDDPYHVYGTMEQRRRFVPHHVLLGWMSETGGVGLLAMLFLLGQYLILIRQRQRKMRTLDLYAVWAVTLGFLIQSFLCNFIFSRIFWIFIAWAVTVVRGLPLVPQHSGQTDASR